MAASRHIESPRNLFLILSRESPGAVFKSDGESDRKEHTLPTRVQVQFTPLGPAVFADRRAQAGFTRLGIVKLHTETMKISTFLPAGGIIDA